jgi:2-keto-3-deoxy-L-rhamnonate aldolase RhmA
VHLSGAEPADLAASMGRLGNAEPASVIGAVIDLVSQAMPIPMQQEVS